MTAPARSRALSAAGTARAAKRAGVAAVGTTLPGTGAALLVLPGPGLLVVIARLAVLATESAWPERRIHQAKTHAANATRAARPRGRRTATPSPPDHERSHP